MSTAWSPEDQDKLFKAVADEFYSRVTAGHCQNCGRSAATHQELQGARQFLADNGITAQMGRGTLRSLAEKLPFQDKDAAAGMAQER